MICKEWKFNCTGRVSRNRGIDCHVVPLRSTLMLSFIYHGSCPRNLLVPAYVQRSRSQLPNSVSTPTSNSPKKVHSPHASPHIHPPPYHLSLPTPTPHSLDQPIPLAQPIQTIVPFTHRSHEAAQRVDLVLARVPPVLVHFAHRYLYGGVVLGFDDATGGRAFAGDVAVEKKLGLVE